jgi:RNA polymerase sigma-70 factor, ECF subfamily
VAALKPFGAQRHEGEPVTLPSAGPNPRREPDSLDFDVVYRTHVQTVARWVARLGGPGADVEDLTQEVFLVVDRRLREFRGESRLGTWLFSITAKLVANDRRRRRLRRWWVRLKPIAVDTAVAAIDSPLEQLETRERRTRFYAALDQLNERQRRALILYELEEMPVAEIAELMGLRPGNVRVLLHRARAAFLSRMTALDLREALDAIDAPGEGE